LNALVNACNQKSNRNPMVSFDDDTMAEALATLKDKRLAFTLTAAACVSRSAATASSNL
jgi:uncharacterized protein YceH (UPF0502 family)